MSYTLNLEPEVRKGAEAYAARMGMTLEGVINAYLVVIARREEVRDAASSGKIRISPKVRALRGSVKLPADFNYDDMLFKSLTERYSSLG